MAAENARHTENTSAAETEHAPSENVHGEQTDASDLAHAAGEHDAHGKGGHARHEVPHTIEFVTTALEKKGYNNVSHFLHTYENTIYSWVVVIVVLLVIRAGLSRRMMIPSRLQNALEYLVEGFDSFVCGILGQKHGRRFLPFLGSLFIFIILNNYMGMIPGMKAPTSAPQTTFALAICVFCYVQFFGIEQNGFFGYIYHLMGSPKSIVEWVMVPLMFPLHIIGEIIKPVSLALRLFGNITGEDILIFVMAMLGTMLAAVIGIAKYGIGLPLQLPIFFLATLLGAIQALVFMLLATIYFMLVLPHDEMEHVEEEQAENL